jgi:uncharacterized protein YndB with AHSA1/START domain
MATEFEVRFDGLLAAGPDAAWAAITTPQIAGWLWEVDYEPRAGGAEAGLTRSGGTVTAWEPPRRFTTRAERPDGWRNQLDYVLEPRAGGTFLHYTHAGTLDDATWDNDYEACRRHTAFYYHSLGEYLRYFAGRQARYAAADGPPASAAAGSFVAALRDLGVPDEASAGERITLDLPGAPAAEATIDYRTAEFLGLRTDDALYRVFGRDAFGWPVGVTTHLFGDDADAASAERAWSNWLAGVFAGRV